MKWISGLNLVKNCLKPGNGHFLVYFNKSTVFYFSNFQFNLLNHGRRKWKNNRIIWVWGGKLELVSEELNHFGLIAGLFRGHSRWYVQFCSFWICFTKITIKSVKVFPFSFWKIIMIYLFFYFIKIKPPA
jgi:hypothetical protein